MSKKRFGLNETIDRGFSEVVNLVENYKGNFDNQPIPLDKIKLDTTNPRYLLLKPDAIRKAKKELLLEGKLPTQNTVEKIFQSIIKNLQADPVGDQQKAKAEAEAIKDLALSILKNGLIHPILLCKKSEGYQVIAGERRYLAHLFLEQAYIDARVFKDNPTATVKKVAQWIENVQREDLTLFSRVENVKHIAEEYLNENNKKLTPTILAEISGISKASASNYLTVANGGQKIMDALQSAQVSNLKIAKLITATKNPDEQERLIAAAAKGESLEKLKKLNLGFKPKSNAGRRVEQANLGKTKDLDALKKIIIATAKEHDLKIIEQSFQQVNWKSFFQVGQLFRKTLISLSSDER